jgi:hypothetical protein
MAFVPRIGRFPGVVAVHPGTPSAAATTEEDFMANEPASPAKDKNYNLVTVLQASLEYVWQMETYIADAERDGDSELAEWFRKIQENNRKAGEQGKQLLAQRLSREEG